MAGKVPQMDIGLRPDDRSFASFMDAPVLHSRASPFSSSFASFLERLDRLHDHVFPPTALAGGLGPVTDIAPSLKIPKLDITSHDKHFLVEIDVPGYDKSDLSIDFVGDSILRITGKHESQQETSSAPPAVKSEKSTAGADGEVKPEKEGDVKPKVPSNAGGQIVKKERLTTSFTRDVPISANAIDKTKVAAALKNGVLSITLPKAEPQAPAHKIQIA